MKPLLLDTFCKAGGTSMGYYQAGFEVVGVDIEPQKRYPFEFHQGDAIEFIMKYGKDFDVIAGSPPCQDYTSLKAISGKSYPRLINATRETMKSTGKPYIIENVKGARFELDNPIMLCGTMFEGLRVIRHRYFECNPVIWWPPRQCKHIGKIGNNRLRNSGGKRIANSFSNVDVLCVSGNDFVVSDGRIAMGIDWMIGKELAQAIPPAYTEWLGKEIRKALNI
jgi:DNA (cytosine-5)-methyltransferase 1